MATPDLLTTAEVATLLGCRVGTVNRWVKLGKLTPVVKLPGRTGAHLYARSDVDELLRDRAA